MYLIHKHPEVIKSISPNNNQREDKIGIIVPYKPEKRLRDEEFQELTKAVIY